jgi:hypothetical protein
LRGLGGKKASREHKADGQGEDLRAEDGLSDALDRLVSAAQLSAPPELARRGEVDLGCQICSRGLEGLGDQNQVSAGAACAEVGAEFRGASLGPVA